MEEINILKVSQFLTKEYIPTFILGAFWGRTQFDEDERYIFSISSFTNVPKFKLEEEEFKQVQRDYLEKINILSMPYNNWYYRDKIKEKIENDIKIPKGNFLFVLENDINITRKSFFNQLYTKILESDWISEEGLTNEKKSFIRGFMELRGSIDTSFGYIAQDYFYQTTFELKRLSLLIDHCDIPYNLFNLNFRELQGEYVEDGKERNTQLRITLLWYIKNIGLINEYKSDIFARYYESSFEGERQEENNIIYFNTRETNYRETDTVGNRLNYYSSNIYGQEIDTNTLRRLREALGFDQERQTFRNRDIVDIVRSLEADECVACKDEHDINDRTFIQKRYNRPYFEIHHVISLGRERELDDRNNLVKLCPVCHACVKKGCGLEEEQRRLVKNILRNSPKAFEFASHYFDNEEFDYVADKVFERLN